MSRVPRSVEFDDVYFSAEDGLAETRHVFLEGNRLAERWAVWPADEVFTICETGFGTGLNFLATLALWYEKRPVGGQIQFVSFEKYPVTRAFIGDHLDHWYQDIGGALDELLSIYPLEQTSGHHNFRIDTDVKLSLIFGDVNEEIVNLQTPVDAWFLDGFKPSSNPDMWSETVFQNMGRLSKKGATFATFTSAGFVRRGLEAAGFDVEKVRGFGHKREMSIGVKR